MKKSTIVLAALCIALSNHSAEAQTISGINGTNPRPTAKAQINGTNPRPDINGTNPRPSSALPEWVITVLLVLDVA